MGYLNLKKICCHKIIFITLLLNLLTFSCYEGLDPTKEISESFVKGKVIVTSGKSSWYAPDSAYELRVVGFKKYPPTDILGEILTGNAFFTDTLPRFLDTIPFNIKFQKPPLEIQYLVAALRYDTSIFKWKVIGVFSDDTSFERTPRKLFIEKGKIIENVVIYVDFRRLPKQPF
ncbi:MAG: hypothetical protein N2517_00935 [Ignavibacteria bacterium]|nr:hypothetical protein [Ignavibacteria bacterium]